MKYTALWGSKGFVVSPTKIVPLLDLKTAYAVKADTSSDASGSATTNNKGKELQSVSLSTLYVRGAGVDPRDQISQWEALVGKAYPLYIEGKRFGPKKLLLKSVTVSDVLLTNTGQFLQAGIALQFEEYANTSGTKKKAATTTKASQIYSSVTVQKNSALSATAKPADRAEKKTTSKVVKMS